MLNEGLLRLGFFLAIFCVLAILETAYPRRTRRLTRKRRWTANWTLVLADTLLLRLMALALPLLAIGAAVDAASRGWGLFNILDLSWATNLILTVLVFDLLIWAQHVLMHKVPFLWRFHQVHHSDEDIDVTTAIRFHPVEIALSMLVKIGAVYLLGASPLAVLVFEIVLNGSAMFNHSNLRLSERADSFWRKIVVTPDMHRVHHSTLRAEHDRNYGFCLSIWDRIFKTYLAQPASGHTGMKIGLRWQDGHSSRIGWLLTLPFQRRSSGS